MTVLDVRGLEVMRNGRVLARNVSFAADRGEIVALMGASGAGKTTTVRAIAGLEPLAAGSITIDGFALSAGHRPRGRELRELHRRVGVVFQFHHLFPHMNALQNVWLALVHVLGEDRPAAERRARGLLEQLGIGERAGAMPSELSGGEAQRVAIARALAVDPQVLLMDEPTASLDAARRAELAATLRQMAAGGRSLVIATHDADFVSACAHRVIEMAGGSVVRQSEAHHRLT